MKGCDCYKKQNYILICKCTSPERLLPFLVCRHCLLQKIRLYGQAGVSFGLIKVKELYDFLVEGENEC